ncbi:TIGR03086 family protein, partial [Clavibacter michiganensis]
MIPVPAPCPPSRVPAALRSALLDALAVGADERIDDDLVRATWTVFAPQK